jgi:hypothetical protein
MGGSVQPVTAFGEEGAVATMNELEASHDASTERLRSAALRGARFVAPLDELPDIGPGECLLGCALNDLLAATDDSLALRRRVRIVHEADRLIEQAGPPPTIAQALLRYGLFRHAHALERIDNRVRWWVGERNFRGRAPPQRLLRWRKLRRVSEERRNVKLEGMAQSDPFAAEWLRALSRWLAASPLSDLASAERSAPRFVWSGAALGLVHVELGKTLALRAIERGGAPSAVVRALREAVDTIGDMATEATHTATCFIGELEAHLARS